MNTVLCSFLVRGRPWSIAVISTAIGCIIGFAVGIVQTIPTNRQENPVHWAVVGFFKGLLNIYVEISRGTPMMVQAAFIYYGAAMLFDIHMGSWTAALFIVSINTGAYMAETVRGGVTFPVDPGQTEGAMAIGMNHMQIVDRSGSCPRLCATLCRRLATI